MNDVTTGIFTVELDKLLLFVATLAAHNILLESIIIHNDLSYTAKIVGAELMNAEKMREAFRQFIPIDFDAIDDTDYIDPDPIPDDAEAYPIRPASHGLTNDAIVGILHYQDYL